MPSEILHTPICRKILMECMGYEDTFHAIEEYIQEFLGEDFRSLALAIRDPDSDNFYFLLKTGNPAFHYFRDKHILSDDLTSYALIHFSDQEALSDPEGFCREKKLQPSSFSTPVAFAPLSVEGRIQGIVICSFHPCGEGEMNPFQRTLRLVAETLSLVLEKIHQFEIISQSLVEMQAISETGVRIYGAKKFDEVLKEIIDNIIEKLGFDRVLIALIDNKTYNLMGRITRGYEESLGQVNLSLTTSSDIFAEVARSGKTQIVQDLRGDQRFPAFMHTRSDVWQCAVVPLISTEGRIWGILSADHKENRGQMTVHRLQVLEEFARHAGIAIENARLYEHIEFMSQIDGLTQVFNRQYFDQAMKREIPRVKRYNQPLSLLMLDVCDFKNFNDRYGHVVGDEILKTVARLLQENVRETDIVARYGGDEFVILMPNTSEDQAKLVRERIERAALQHHNNEQDQKKQFRISLGLRSATALNVDNILIEADRAMYKGRELHVKQSLLHALIANDVSEVERWDRFIANILKILTEKEPHFHNHSRRVMNYAVRMCQILGLDSYFLEVISIASLLHDIGKISISSELLRSTSPLTPEEYEIVKTHTVLGVDLLKAADYLKEVREIISNHHERWDGKTDGSFPGYLEGRSADAIPLGARILKLADSYDAMTSLRPYAQPLNQDEAIRIILNEQGRSFDPQIVKVFVPYLRTITTSLSGSLPL